MSESSSAAPGPIEVSIGGRRYRLRGEDPEALRRLAARVDRTIEDIAGSGEQAADPRVAILAALNIAGDDDELRVGWLAQARELAERARALRARARAARAALDDAEGAV